MKSSRSIKKVVLIIFLLVPIIAGATIWPVPESGRKGIMNLYGDYRSVDAGCNFHAAIDITQNTENDAKDSCNVPVLCCEDSTVICYIVNTPTGAGELELKNIDGIILKSNGIYHFYAHVKGIDPDDIRSKPTYPAIPEGEKLGYIGEENDEAYGGSSAHLHFGLFGGTLQEDRDFFKRDLNIPNEEDPIEILGWFEFNKYTTDYWPLENPLNILPNADAQDLEPPIFANSDVSGTPIDLVPNLIYDFINGNISENGYVDKNKCPWVVRGKIDIIARVNDYMDVKGYFA
ncbi:hypothetical protein K8T06_17080, partial [bacterium]|nr:hypothetical protein [bacterium]